MTRDVLVSSQPSAIQAIDATMNIMKPATVGMVEESLADCGFDVAIAASGGETRGVLKDQGHFLQSMYELIILDHE